MNLVRPTSKDAAENLKVIVVLAVENGNLLGELVPRQALVDGPYGFVDEEPSRRHGESVGASGECRDASRLDVTHVVDRGRYREGCKQVEGSGAKLGGAAAAGHQDGCLGSTVREGRIQCRCQPIERLLVNFGGEANPMLVHFSVRVGETRSGEKMENFLASLRVIFLFYRLLRRWVLFSSF